VKTIFSTAAVHQRDRFDYWHSVACKTVVPHDAVPECRQAFRAELAVGRLAVLGLLVFENAPMAVSHTARHIPLVTSDELFVCRQLAGRLELEQEGRARVLAPGDFTLLDPLLPYTARFAADSRLFVLRVPRRALEIRVGRARDVILCPATQAHAERALTASILAMLPAHAEALSPVAQQLLSEQVLDFLAISLGRDTVSKSAKLSAARALVLMKIRAAIDARLADPTLDAAGVARAAGVSVRYANVVLAAHEMSIRRLILQRRLMRCRRALEDPAQRHRTVSEIAYGWGFSDMTHFGRAFKAAYGLLPSEVRKK
jgi:AraC family transcriptional activator of tynA and feaB